MNFKRVIAIDPSLTCSGWALFSLPEGELQGVGKIRSRPSEFNLSERLLDLQEKIMKLFSTVQLSANDVLICEAPTTMRDPRAAIKVEQVRCMFETLARSRNAYVPGRLNPRSVHREIMGLGGSQIPRAMIKDIAQSVARALYSSALERIQFDTTAMSFKRNQDIVDALLLGSLAVVRVRTAISCSTPLPQLLEGKSVKRRISRKALEALD